MASSAFAVLNRRTQRSPVNPMDKTTIISIFPKEIHEIKHTIQPGVFHLSAGSYEVPSFLTVGSSSWWKEIDEHQPLLEIPTSSIQIADAIVRDFCNGLVGCNMGDTMPGIFYLPGEIDKVKLIKEYKPLLEDAQSKQKKFWQLLIKMADTLWARTNGNPLSISDDARLAARTLGLVDKPWLKDYQAAELVQCKACGSLKNPLFPVCGNCKHIDNLELASKLGIKLAQ